GSTALGDDRGDRRPRLGVDAECGVERGGHAVLEHRPAFVGELVTHRTGALRMEYGRMVLDLIAVRTDDGVLVALPAAAGIEQRTETDLGRERAVEDGATAVELRSLGGGETTQRVARLRRPGQAAAPHRATRAIQRRLMGRPRPYGPR